MPSALPKEGQNAHHDGTGDTVQERRRETYTVDCELMWQRKEFKRKELEVKDEKRTLVLISHFSTMEDPHLKWDWKNVDEDSKEGGQPGWDNGSATRKEQEIYGSFPHWLNNSTKVLGLISLPRVN